MEIKEIWKDVIEYENYYMVSNKGNVKSLNRLVSNGNGFHTLKGKILKKGTQLSGYSFVNLNKECNCKSITVHKLVAMAFLGYKPDGTNKLVIDHIDGNKRNNNLCNVRILTNRENLSVNKRGSSKYTGVHWHIKTKKWCANIYVNGKREYLGSFDVELEAHYAYQLRLKEIT